MRLDFITIFPRLIEDYLSDSIMKRELLKGTIEAHTHDIRSYSKDKHHKVDARPYGGGAGMLMTPQPLYDCIMAVKKLNPKAPVIYMAPRGRTFTYKTAKRLARKEGLIILCGRYEGIDERIRELCIDEEISIGKYVLAGGELPALVVAEAVTRLLPGALGDERSAHEDSFTEALDGKREYPHYTRPPVFKGLAVPEVLQKGNHADIARWRKDKLT
ncbi:tRNA (guanosine(37)-N1)-methyltransferase TrmD [Candidatus Peregrinibacteria bacterium CG_4_9_14_0_2_um_filter_53_11]|nr:MAG: tRNA (guanosine(37)-N1)-methyltransferase TrmD [Candidatus Peregrinibacteria bacterium CG_4_9_14_0_2_um_filter_53_11]